MSPFDDDGEPIALDDATPGLRALAMIFDHAHQRREAGLPGACRCNACEQIRACLRAERDPDGGVTLYYAPPAEPR